MPDPTVFERHLAEARAGSGDALGRVLERYRLYLLQVARAEVGPAIRARAGASDIVQETFLDAMQHFAQFRGGTEDEFRHWLRRLLQHNAIDIARYLMAQKRAAGREAAPGPGDAADELTRLPAPAPTPSAQAIGREGAERLEELIDRQPPDYRRVLRLRYLEDRSFEEIAREMGRSVNAVTLLWLRAVRRLRPELEPGP